MSFRQDLGLPEGHDYSEFMERVAKKYSRARKIVLIQDNLNTHNPSSFYENMGKRSFLPTFSCLKIIARLILNQPFGIKVMTSTREAEINKPEFYLGHVQNWQQSGMSQEKYCQSVNISYSTFVYWRAKLLGKGKKISANTQHKFIRLDSSSADKVESPTSQFGFEKIIVYLPNGIQLYFPLSVNPICLGDYIKAIGLSQ